MAPRLLRCLHHPAKRFSAVQVQFQFLRHRHQALNHPLRLWRVRPHPAFLANRHRMSVWQVRPVSYPLLRPAPVRSRQYLQVIRLKLPLRHLPANQARLFPHPQLDRRRGGFVDRFFIAGYNIFQFFQRGEFVIFYRFVRRRGGLVAVKLKIAKRTTLDIING